MRKFTLLALAIVLGLPAFAQQNVKSNAVASPEQMNAKVTFTPFQNQLTSFEDQNLLRSTPHAAPVNYSTNKTSTVSPIKIGSAANAFTILRNEQNQVVACDSLGMVSFIHRFNISDFGGTATENGKYCYDMSIDGGATWGTDIGPVQTVYTNYGRYPNLTAYNPGSTTNPFDAKLVYCGPTNHFPTPGWIGHVYGVADISATTQASVSATENYLFDADQTLLPGGLCQGKDGEFWATELEFDGSAATDNIRLMKGTWNSGTGDVDWVLHTTLAPGYDKSFDGTAAVVGPNVAFSPDGMTGWIGMLSNITAGTNTNNETLMPVFMKSTDGGATWGSAVEVDLDGIAWIGDSLTSFWVDTSGNPAGSGLATTGFDYDITVDNNGNVHMGVVIGNNAGGFSISSGIEKFMADVYTTDGGATWDVAYISPVLTFRGEFGAGGSNAISQDNFCQISRNETGDRIFYSWVDSDTSTVTGNASGVGFGVSDNTLPNLRVASRFLTGDTRTFPMLVSDLDAVWEGAILFPTMAPTVLTNGNDFNMPIVVMSLRTNDAGQPVDFYYFGNDAKININDYCPTDTVMPLLWWDTFGHLGATLPQCAFVAVDTETENNFGFTAAPNPFNNELNVTFELEKAGSVDFRLVDMNGREIYKYESGNLSAGIHRVPMASSVYNDLPGGVYFLTGTFGNGKTTKKLVKID